MYERWTDRRTMTMPESPVHLEGVPRDPVRYETHEAVSTTPFRPRQELPTYCRRPCTPLNQAGSGYCTPYTGERTAQKHWKSRRSEPRILYSTSYWAPTDLHRRRNVR